MRLYLIGAGVIAGYHADAAQALAGDNLNLAVADPNPAALTNFVQHHPTARTFASATDMLAGAAQADDIVVVATPPVTHYALTLAALHSGRHVLCEKPLALDMAQATEMVDLARTLGLHIGCCSSRFLALSTTNAVKQLLREGGVGAPYHLTFVQRHQRSRSGIEYQPIPCHGAVTWDWLMLAGEGEVVHRCDHAGHVTSTIVGCDHREGVPFHHKPLTFFYRVLQGETAPAILGEQARFNFACLRALYDCAATGQPQTVQKREIA